MEDISRQKSGKMKWSPLIFITLAHLMVILDTTIMIVALPSIQGSLQISVAERQWIVTAYTLAFAGLLLLCGRLAERFGAKRTLIIGAAGFAIASLIGGFASSSTMLIVARAIEGCFGAILVSSTRALLALIYTNKNQRAKAMGVFSATLAMGAACGLVLGGILTSMINWRWCLFINFPISIVVIIGAMPTLPLLMTKQKAQIDFIGAGFFCIAMIALVYGMGEIAAAGWSSPNVIISICAFLVFTPAFVLLQRKIGNPLLPLRILKERNRAGSYVAMVFNSLGSFGMLLILTYQLQKVMHYSALSTGVVLIPFALSASMVSAFLSPYLLHKIKPKWLIAGGVLFSGLGILPIIFLNGGVLFWPLLFGSEILEGIGTGIGGAPSIFTSLQGVKTEDVSIASSATSAANQVGSSLGAALFNTIAVSVTAAYAFSHKISSTDISAITHGFMWAGLWGTFVLIVASIIVFLLINAPTISKKN